MYDTEELFDLTGYISFEISRQMAFRREFSL